MFPINLKIYLIYFVIMLNNQRFLPLFILSTFTINQGVRYRSQFLYRIPLCSPRYSVLVALAAIRSFIIKCLNQIGKHGYILWIRISYGYTKPILRMCY